MKRSRTGISMVGGVLLAALALGIPVAADASGGYRHHGVHDRAFKHRHPGYKQRHHGYKHRHRGHRGGHGRHWRGPRHRVHVHDPFRHHRWYGGGGHFSFYGSSRHSGFAISLPLATYRPPPPPVYRYVEVAPAPLPPAVASTSVPPAGCAQTREFRTEIIIDGRPVQAYGTACLMPDGTWKQLGLHAAR